MVAARWALAAILVEVAPASADAPAVHLRLALGGGYAASEGTHPGEGTARIAGVTATGLVHAGIKFRRVAVHADLTATRMIAPSLTMNDQPSDADVGVSVLVAGAGVTYVAGADTSISGGIGWAAEIRSYDRGASNTNSGVALTLSIAKEWRVSPQWDAGIALQLVGAAIPMHAEYGGYTRWFTAVSALGTITY